MAGRPQKNTVDFFPHDCSHKSTMLIIEKRYANDGYSLWYKLLEILGSTPNHFIDYKPTEVKEYIAARANMSSEKATEILNLFSTLNAIDKELWETHSIIWSENFLNRLMPLYNKRPNTPFPNRPNPNGYRNENVTTTTISTPKITPMTILSIQKSPTSVISDNENTQTKLNKTKLKKEIYKERIYDTEILKIWNSQKIVVHKKINEPIKKAIDKALKNYTFGEITSAIVTYGSIVTNPTEYYFNHKWALEQFLTRKNGIIQFIDEKIARDNFRIKNNKKQSQVEINTNRKPLKLEKVKLPDDK